MQLIANETIKFDSGDAGTARPGQTFELEDAYAKPLIASGAAYPVEELDTDNVDTDAVKAPSALSTPLTPSKPLDKMNRTELEEYATKIGVEGPFERFETKAALVEAITHILNLKKYDSE